MKSEVHFVSLADNFTVQFSNLLKVLLEWKTKQLNGPGNYRELRETGPRPPKWLECGNEYGLLHSERLSTRLSVPNLPRCGGRSEESILHTVLAVTLFL